MGIVIVIVIVIVTFMSMQLMNHTFRQVLNKNITFAEHEYGCVGVFRVEIRSLVQKL